MLFINQKTQTLLGTHPLTKQNTVLMPRQQTSRTRAVSYQVGTLHLNAQTEFWQNSIPFFGEVAFCMNEIVIFWGALKNRN